MNEGIVEPYKMFHDLEKQRAEYNSGSQCV